MVQWVISYEDVAAKMGFMPRPIRHMSLNCSFEAELLLI
jgi:hypothetical protein